MCVSKCVYLQFSFICAKLTSFADNLAFLIDGEHHYSLLPSLGIKPSDILGFSPQESRTWESGTNLAPFDTEVCS